ncbi:MAG: CapA family protein [Planctomycetota bacterium]
MQTVTLFLAGDVMTGRGVDQVLDHPGAPTLHEPGVRDARRYVELAAAAHGPIPAPVEAAYPWGEALAILEERAPQARIVNLETSITTSGDWCRGKDVHYRMHPANIDCLTVAGIHVAGLANNHTLDWGRAGLAETIATLERAGIRTAGAGRTAVEARKPAVVPLGVAGRQAGRLLVWAVGSTTSGIPDDWAATDRAAGIDLLDAADDATADALVARVAAEKRVGDLAVVSIHWGTNWGFDVPASFGRFARRLIDGGVDLVHGHSSHHVRPIEIHRDRLILHGCGDLIDDYEGIAGPPRYRGDLGILYFVTLETGTGRLESLEMVPLQMRRLRLCRVDEEDARWLCETLTRISRPVGCSVELKRAGVLSLRW